MGSWDLAQVPKPFSTVAVVIGEPIEVVWRRRSRHESARTRLSARSRVSKRALPQGAGVAASLLVSLLRHPTPSRQGKRAGAEEQQRSWLRRGGFVA